MLRLAASPSAIGCTLRALLVTGILFLGWARKAAAEPDEKDSQVEALIEQLASPNQRPLISARGGADPRDLDPIPNNYDVNAQKKVMAAWGRLAAMGEKAFNSLIAHLGDERYSYTYVTGPGALHNQSVSDACAAILGNSINAYRSLARPLFTGRKPEFFPYELRLKNGWKTSGELKSWFAERRGKQLWELQVEAAQWAIENEKERGLRQDEPPPLGSPAKSTREAQMDLDRVLGSLSSLVKELQTTKKPAQVAVTLPDGVMGVSIPGADGRPLGTDETDKADKMRADK
jgi:hypothetical protein